MSPTMSRSSRIILALSTSALILLFFLPLWSIKLEAPQYPEGLGIHIWINDITGVKKHDLQNLNGLNHYIGMRTIEPDEIPELEFMPYILGAIIVLGYLAVLIGKRKLALGWVSLVVFLALVGLVDYYMWGHDFGHNLDLETAAIKIPGMTYQPPLFGSKKILNFTATSLPASGGWIAIAAFFFAGVAVALDYRIFHKLTPSKRRSA